MTALLPVSFRVSSKPISITQKGRRAYAQRPNFAIFMRLLPQHIDHAATQGSTGPLLPNQRFGALCRIISCGISTCRPGRLSFLRTALGGMRLLPQHIDHAATQRSTGPLLPNQRFGALCRIISRGIRTCRPGRLNFLRTALGGMRLFRNISTMRLRKGPPDLCSQIKDLEPCAASSQAALVHAALAD